LNTSFVLQTSAGSKKIVGVFYKAGEYADKNPNFVGCVEGALGIRGWLESQGHQYIVTDDKEGPNCGQYSPTTSASSKHFVSYFKIEEQEKLSLAHISRLHEEFTQTYNSLILTKPVRSFFFGYGGSISELK
jgi:formate dehydrogenase